MKKKIKIIIGILIAAVIAAAGITWYVMNQKNQKTGNSSAEVVAWDVDIEEEEPSEEKGILIPGYTSMVMKANTKEQTVSACKREKCNFGRGYNRSNEDSCTLSGCYTDLHFAAILG